MRVQVNPVVVVELLMQFVRDAETHTKCRVEINRFDRVDLTVTVRLLVVLDVVPHGTRGDDDDVCVQFTV
ncbi:hypothetical protein D3C86_2197200 [compost metagenome]